MPRVVTRKPQKKIRQNPITPRATRAPQAAQGPQLLQPTPRSWLTWADEVIPTYVKSQYSPKESWKAKPFSTEDARFFLKGIEELSSLFTEDRPSKLPAYFHHARFRSSYLLYFLPLQSAKFLTLFRQYPQAMQAALSHGQAQGKIRILDLGAGPGTASFAFLIWLLEEIERKGTSWTCPPIDLLWIDTHRSILDDGRKLLEAFSQKFPSLDGKITLTTHVGDWKDAHRFFSDDISLTLSGNVLNEGDQDRAFLTWERILQSGHLKGGGALWVEPAARRPSQLLSRLRDHLFETRVIPESPTSLWGPCLHAGRCPMASGRDWCHFSVRSRIPGKWFEQFSKGLGSEREWLKFSYLWISSPDSPAPVSAPNLRRVISDPMNRIGKSGTVLLCEPELPFRLKLRDASQTRRGDLLQQK